MVYAETITIAANTTKASATKTIMPVTKGLIWKVEVDFPPGCCGLVHFQLFDGGYQLLPASPGETVHGDGWLIGFDDLYLKVSPPWELQIITWNLDEVWDHTLQVRVGLASERAFMARYMPGLAWEEFEKILAEAALGQEMQRQAQAEQILSELTGG